MTDKFVASVHSGGIFHRNLLEPSELSTYALICMGRCSFKHQITIPHSICFTSELVGVLNVELNLVFLSPLIKCMKA